MTRERKKPETQVEPLRFQAIKVRFEWSDDDWAVTHLPWVRMAACQVGSNQNRLMEMMNEFIASGRAPEMLDGLVGTKEHLQALVKLIEVALTRSFLVLEQFGYSPDNPPPDRGFQRH